MAYGRYGRFYSLPLIWKRQEALTCSFPGGF